MFDIGPTRIGVIVRDPKSQLYKELKEALPKGQRVLLRHRCPTVTDKKGENPNGAHQGVA